ncbi:hypothetical protein CPB86DRAFT_778460 [Serendipita vermifera]|nr:hypothetical protein CPB86DRAFT_778460 [Serendipita vermifera]
MADTEAKQEICTDCDPNAPSPASAPSKTENPLDQATFTPPVAGPYPRLVIEYCDRCRWLHRAAWVMTELSITFPAPIIKSSLLVPITAPDPAGRFRVWLLEEPEGHGSEIQSMLLWDRKLEDGFPELKALKQKVRDKLQPAMTLGHSDKK